MSPEIAVQVQELVDQASTAVSNAKARSRLRGESVELVIAAARLDEANELLRLGTP
jgi:hypothetical protein